MAYLLPCPQCDRKLAVTTGQAGEQIRCNCGAAVDVPTVRGLRMLEVAADERQAQRAWTASQALVFLGLLIAIGGLAFGVVSHFRAAAVLPNENFADHIRKMPPGETWALWTEFFRHGIGWNPRTGPQQLAALANYAELKRWALVGYGVGGGGALLAIIGFLLTRPRRPIPAKRPPKKMQPASPKKKELNQELDDL